MKDEIKEIIDNLIRFRNEDNKFQPEDILTIEDVWLLLDYITNLQQKNEKLENDKRGMLVQLYKANVEKDNYKLKYERMKENVEILSKGYSKLEKESERLKGKIKTLENNCQQAENSCRQHRLANKNHIRRLKRREKQINLYKSKYEKATTLSELRGKDNE